MSENNEDDNYSQFSYIENVEYENYDYENGDYENGEYQVDIPLQIVSEVDFLAMAKSKKGALVKPVSLCIFSSKNYSIFTVCRNSVVIKLISTFTANLMHLITVG